MKIWNRRNRTIALGAAPVVVLVTLLGLPSIPGTDIDLTVPYAAEGKGPTFNTLGEEGGKQVVEVTGAETSKPAGHLNMTTVSVHTKLTLGQALARWLTTDDTLVPIGQIFPANKSPEEVQQQNQAAFAASESNATTAAMNYLNKPLETAVIDVLDDAPAAGKIKVNDVIREVGGRPITTPDELARVVGEHAPGDEIDVLVERQGKEETVTVTLGEPPKHLQRAGQGSAFLGVTSVSQPAGEIRVRYNLQDVGGPSAGLMFSLAVVDKLTPQDLTGGAFVAGTGSIDAAGQVGAIGGITHKIRAAADAGAEYFLVPAGNCAEALTVEDAGPKLVKVDSLEDAVKDLEGIRSGGGFDTCS
ncbi:PDZ domain-containing protein [Corynebacterium urealyticum]|uniref:endopeptidase La n=1 Tax=Corynebacterium urealyticum (strain ATCC 43042 / DSM 7109) TaxID=504474 RepID=B1VFD1_CORU7|nr:PDZ domain-containing protein [Corynebacterium urealyticum]QQC42032.1 PDZ domain-containing protein [Corynebacterium urealyticum]QQE50655.1 PDZ domain-containing protein [Corynebacterium urealyticum]TYR15555.1 PDZ domain-containing protein [Corynebacterium urealyticum]TYR17892.1 PDZ domain-containing protein [Corynebacterium urealyticum]TYT21985.1 PDZ domain-containing protein [Corynebacterium urealyticum]